MMTRFGRFIPGDSVLHRLDPRVKFMALIVYVVTLFAAPSNWMYLLSAVALLTTLVVGKIPAARLFRDLKGFALLLAFTFFLRGFLMDMGDPLWRFGILSVSNRSLGGAVHMTARIFLMIAGAGCLAYVTTPKSLADGIERAGAPLTRFGIPVHDLALIVSLALRLVPIMVDEANGLVDAQASRGLDLRTLGPIAKVRSMGALLVPLFVLAVRRASSLAVAMEARGYDGSLPGTKMRELRYGKTDYLAYAAIGLYAIVFVVLSFLLVGVFGI